MVRNRTHAPSENREGLKTGNYEDRMGGKETGVTRQKNRPGEKEHTGVGQQREKRR